MKWLVALAAGLVAGGAVTAWRLNARGRELAARGQQLQASLVAGGDDLRTYLIAQRETIEADLAALGAAEVERVARVEAERFLGSAYGLTPERMRRLQTLSERWT